MDGCSGHEPVKSVAMSLSKRCSSPGSCAACSSLEAQREALLDKGLLACLSALQSLAHDSSVLQQAPEASAPVGSQTLKAQQDTKASWREPTCYR